MGRFYDSRAKGSWLITGVGSTLYSYPPKIGASELLLHTVFKCAFFRPVFHDSDHDSMMDPR